MLSGRTKGASLLLAIGLLVAIAVPLGAEAQRMAPGTDREDVLAAADYTWIVENGTHGVDLIATPANDSLPHLAARVGLQRGAVEAVYAISREDGLAPVFQIAFVPLLVSFDPPIPIGSGLRSVEPLRLDWNIVEVTEEDRLVAVHATAEIPLPVNGTSPGDGDAQGPPSGTRFRLRVDVVEAPRADEASGLRHPAAVRVLWILNVPGDAVSDHEVAWRVLLDSRTQNFGGFQNGTGEDRFQGVYTQRGPHHAAHRFLPHVAADAPAPAIALGPPRGWHITDLLTGPIPRNDTFLLPLELLATTAAPLVAAGETASDGIALELGFHYAPTTPPADGPDGTPPPNAYPGAPSWWHLAVVLLVALLVVAPPWRRVRATNA